MYQTAIQAPGFEHRFAAELLNARAAELAERAARLLLESRPDLDRGYRPQARAKWTEHYQGRISDLAAAVAAARPDVFVAQVAWTKVAFATRGVPLEDLEQSLRALERAVLPAMAPEDAPLVESFIERAMSELGGAPTSVPSRLTTATASGHLAAEYLLRLLEGDRIEAARLVQASAHGGTPVRTLYREVLLPVLHELGRMWHVGDITIAEEHFATATTQQVMAQLMAGAERKAWDGRIVVSAAVEGNTHELGARCVADFCEMAGWRCVYLGPSIPVPDLATAAVDFGAHLLALSATLPAHLRAVEDTITLIRQELGEQRPRIMVGGAAFNGVADLWRVYGADGFADNADRAVEVADELVPPRIGVRPVR